MLPLFPSYLSFITGMSVGDLSADLTAAARRRVLLHAVTFVLGFSVVFVALGASFSAAGQLLLEYRDVIRRIGGALIIVFGLYIAGLLKIGFFGRTQQWQIREKPAGYLGSFLVGVTFAIGWTPCVGPILGAILSLAGTPRPWGAGIGLLIAYSAGLGVPFLLSAIALGSFLRFFKRYRPFIPVVERGAGRAARRGRRARLHQLLHRAQLLGDLAHPGVAAASGSERAARASTFAFPPPRPTSGRASTRSAWRWRSTTR